MRNLKKVLVMVLCLAMMASIMVTGAAAAFTDQQDIDPKHQEAVDMAIALKIIEGYPDGSFQPNGNVTRAEMSKIICIALNGGEVPATSVKPTPTFADTKGHWAEGFIEYCYAKGVVAGKSADTFDPSGSVTGSEAAKMLLVALGYNAEVEKYVGSDWELYVNVQANQDGLYNKLLDIETAEPLSREHAAQMIWNALESDTIYKHSQIDRTTGDITDVYNKDTGYEMLDKYYDGETFTGIMTTFSYNSTDKEWTYQITAFDSQGNVDHQYEFVSGTDFTNLFGMKVKAVFDKDGTTWTSERQPQDGTSFDAYGIFAKDSSVVVAGIVADIDDGSVRNNEVKINGTTYKTDDANANDVEVAFFGPSQRAIRNASPYDLPEDLGELVDDGTVSGAVPYDYLCPMEMCAIDNNNNGKIDLIIVKPVIVGQVTYVGNKSFNVDTFDNVFNDVTRYNFDDVTRYEGMAADDFVLITPDFANAQEDTVIAKAEVLNSGTVSSVNGAGTKATIDGTTYNMMPSVVGALAAKDTIKDAPVLNGYMFDVDASGGKSVEEYAIVIGMDIPQNASNTIDSTRVKLLLSDGSKVVGTVADYDWTTGEEFNPNSDYYRNVEAFLEDLYNDGNGCMVTFEKNSDGDYELTPVYPIAAGSGFDKYINPVVQPKTDTGTKVTYIDGSNIADDATIFLHDGDSWKVVTGAKLKTLAYTQTNWQGVGVERAFGEKDSNGYMVVQMAYLTTNAKAVQADTLYGYVTAEPLMTSNADGKTVWQYEVYTEDGQQTLYTSTRSVGINANVAKGDVIEVEQNDSNEVTGIDIIARTKTGDVFGAIECLSAYDGTYISYYDRFDDVNDEWVISDRYEIDKDTVILYVSGADKAGVEGSTSNIRKAASVGKEDGVDIAYYPNAVVVTNERDHEVDLLVMDVNNDILDINN